MSVIDRIENAKVARYQRERRVFVSIITSLVILFAGYSIVSWNIDDHFFRFINGILGVPCMIMALKDRSTIWLAQFAMIAQWPLLLIAYIFWAYYHASMNARFTKLSIIYCGVVGGINIFAGIIAVALIVAV